MAAKLVADSTLYHLAPRGFWKKFRDAVVVNPEISSGLPLPSVHRYPQPASRPERYATPATKASDPAQNPYWKRDVRRAYPRLSVVTQDQLSTFLLQKPVQASVSAPGESKDNSTEASSVPVAQQTAKDLPSAIAAAAKEGKLFSESKLPPQPPSSFKRWTPQNSPDAPHDPNAYFPMSLVH
ncbi:NADH dehydrogenase [Rickenella mellea]|uniref:NADH dehydrogenase n=1 Tax=Rickenella mellea TaxID=50990 RepID=A0A4Y7QGX7_9AGAM|nr:NADH dehydrogenase [Rickenella mellea]